VAQTLNTEDDPSRSDEAGQGQAAEPAAEAEVEEIETDASAEATAAGASIHEAEALSEAETATGAGAELEHDSDRRLEHAPDPESSAATGTCGQFDPGEETAAAPPDRRIIALANQKGGVGKTTTAVNLGACAAELGRRTLIVDLDPQANATTGLGLNPPELEYSMYDVLLRDTPMEDVIEPVSVENLFVAPSSLDLAGAEVELVPGFNRERRLLQALTPIVEDYDVVLIDCPPSLGLLTVNGLTAAREVLVPIQTEYYALEGLGQLIRNVDLVTRSLNPTLRLTTIVLVMFDARTKLSGQVVDQVREHFGDKVCRHVVPRSVRLSEAPSFGQPIIVFDPESRGAEAYRALAKEIFQ